MFDSNWATDKNDRRSISSYLTTIGGTSLVNWQSKKQQTVALSSCKSETMAGTMCAQDVLFTMNLLKELVGDLLLEPSYIYGDNVASLFMAQNNSTSQRTKHIDIRERFMSELVEDKRVELRHVKTDKNTSDINSKNTKVEIHKKMADRLYNGLAIAEVKYDNSDTNKRLSKSSKEDVEYSYAIGVDDMLAKTCHSYKISSGYENRYVSRTENQLKAQAKNLANPVKSLISDQDTSEVEMLSRPSEWAIVKRRHWKQGQYKAEDEHSSKITSVNEQKTNRPKDLEQSKQSRKRSTVVDLITLKVLSLE